MSSFTIFGHKFKLNHEFIQYFMIIMFIIYAIRFGVHMLKVIWGPKKPMVEEVEDPIMKSESAKKAE